MTVDCRGVLCQLQEESKTFYGEMKASHSGFKFLTVVTFSV